MKRTQHYSWKSGSLPKGCQLCVKGQKLVLFITGLCPRSCFYCPISEKKHQKDVVYADEWPVRNEKEVLKEAELISAKGAGITGGDPLTQMDRTIKYIKLLKKRFGGGFHIHLYTSLELVDKSKAKKLYNAGLDEIRVHPDIYSDKLWHKAEILANYEWDLGIEIPVIPGAEKQTRKLIDYFSNRINFLNLNELEMADNKAQKMLGTFVPKDRISYGIKGSEEVAKKLLKAYENRIKRIHYCTTTLKERVQMGNRIKRRARNVKKPYDYVTKEGMLVRGVIYGDAEKLEKLKNSLNRKYKIPKELLEVDKAGKRLLTTTAVAENLGEELKEKGFKPATVIEYPTWDQFPVEINYI